MHEGHRKRMLSRAESDVAGMNDHELLEIVLFRTIPRQNTNPLAHELISAFGSLEGVFRASFEQLLAVKGVGRRRLHIFKRSAKLSAGFPQGMQK